MANLRVMEPREPYNTKEDIPALNEHILELERSLEDTTWAKADAFLKARELFGLSEFAKQTGRVKELGTMKVYANVAESYPSVNRFTTVSFKHHMVAMNNDSRYEWLKKAQDNAWSAERLRREINPPKPVAKKEPVPERKIEPEIVKQSVDPYGPLTPEDPRPDAVTIQEIANTLNFNLAQNPMEVQQWAEAYVNLVNSLFMYKTTARIWYNPAGVVFEVIE